MSDLLPYVIVGIASGSVYGLAGMGLVLTYKTSGVFNFGHGAVAAVGAAAFYELQHEHGAPWPVALVVAVIVVGGLGGLGLEAFARSLARASTATRIVASVGLLLAIQGAMQLRYGLATIRFSPFLPTGTFRIVGVNVGYDQLITTALALGLLVALYAFFRVSRMGVAMRAVVEDPALVALMGTSPRRVRRAAWTVGAAFAALSGILLAPAVGLDATLLTLLVVQAFGAAAIGAFSSLPLTHLGGIAIGIGAALSTKYVIDLPTLQGFPPSLPFIVLFVVLVALPPSRLPRVDAWTGGLIAATGGVRVSRRTLAAIAPVVAVVLVAVPSLVGTDLPVVEGGLVNMMQLLSLAVLVRLSGQVSLCHLGFGAIGAAAFSHLAVGAGVPWLLAVVLAGVVAIPVGALVALPAIRLSGVYLAIATFGFGILLERLVYPTGFMFGTGSSGLVTPRPGVLGLSSDRGYYYVLLAATVVIALMVVGVSRARIGRLLRGMADSPVALGTLGARVNVIRVLIFCISAFLAAIAGALSGPVVGRASAGSYSSFTSLLLLVVLLISGRGMVAAPALASVFLVLPRFVDALSFLQDYEGLLFGLAAMSAASFEKVTGDSRSAARAMVGRVRRRPGDRRGPARSRSVAASAGAAL